MTHPRSETPQLPMTTANGATPLALVRRRRAGAVLGAVMLLNTACYTYAPVASTSPQPGERVAIDITDQGRIHLGDQLGSGVARVEGLLNANQGDEYLVSVTKVGY